MMRAHRTYHRIWDHIERIRSRCIPKCNRGEDLKLHAILPVSIYNIFKFIILLVVDNWLAGCVLISLVGVNASAVARDV